MSAARADCALCGEVGGGTVDALHDDVSVRVCPKCFAYETGEDETETVEEEAARLTGAEEW